MIKAISSLLENTFTEMYKSYMVRLYYKNSVDGIKAVMCDILESANEFITLFSIETLDTLLDLLAMEFGERWFNRLYNCPQFAYMERLFKSVNRYDLFLDFSH